RQIDSGYFERSMISTKKLSPVVRQTRPELAEVFRDTYIFDFLRLPKNYSEKDLRGGLICSFKEFVLEFGKDFAFVGEEYKVQVGKGDYFIDLLFYHRELRCLVAFGLKIEDFKPEFLGKLNFYLEALDRDVRKKHENPSVGVILCKSKDDEVVEYSLSRNLSPALVSEYKTKLIDKGILKKKLHELYLISTGEKE
ncbi:MAG: PDDEXK nuclease domain-containing protein, partial [Candidatus Woesearchaeota archaeon]|nr:PDDEXK nuclease domain-containing protein [Candidatus Woesearchaeota archaeon]